MKLESLIIFGDCQKSNMKEKNISLEDDVRIFYIWGDIQKFPDCTCNCTLWLWDTGGHYSLVYQSAECACMLLPIWNDQ